MNREPMLYGVTGRCSPEGRTPSSTSTRAGRLGRRPGLAGVVESYARRVFGLLVRQCGDRELAEEITQATFVQVVHHIGRYKEQGKFEPWLFRIAMNRLRDEMRRRRRQARSMDMSGGRSEENAPWNRGGRAGDRSRGHAGWRSPGRRKPDRAGPVAPQGDFATGSGGSGNSAICGTRPV